MLQCEKYHSAERGAFNQPPSWSKMPGLPISMVFDRCFAKIRGFIAFVAC
jgi:hypothetical protein